MARVLIVTKNFPPFGNQIGWMVRMVELSNFLAARGHAVSVVSLRRSKTYAHLLSVDPRVSVRYVDDPLTGGGTLPGMRVIKRVLRQVRDIFADRILIDRQQILLAAFRKKIRTVVASSNIDTVIVSSPPCSFRLLSPWFKSEYGNRLKVIADYRDAWTIRSVIANQVSTRRLNRQRVLEQKTLDANDLTLFVSTGMRNQYQSRFRLGESMVVENGFVEREKSVLPPDIVDQLDTWKRDGRLIVGYVGTGSVIGEGHKDFRRLVDIVADEPDFSDKVAFVFAGRIHGLQEYSARLKMIDMGVVSHEDAFALIARIDVGLMAYSESLEAPAIMGGKIYDYVAGTKPIWFVVPPNAESIHAFMHKHGKGYMSDAFSSEEIHHALTRILSDFQSGRLKDQALTPVDAQQYRRENQYSLLLPHIGPN